MADITCKKCGYSTFLTFALKDEKGRSVCPQCRELYFDNALNVKPRKVFPKDLLTCERNINSVDNVKEGKIK